METKEEILKEINMIQNAYTNISKKDFLSYSENLTENHYEYYLNRMKSYEKRLKVLQEKLEFLNKIEGLSKKYPNNSQEEIMFLAKFF